MNNNNQQQQQKFQQNMQMGSGLTRYRSAPSSYFASFLDAPTADVGFAADEFEQLFNPRASSPETQRIFSRFMNTTADTVQENSFSNMTPPSKSQFLPPRNKEPEPQHQLQRQQSNEYSSPSQIMYQSRNSEAANSNSYNRLLDSFSSNHVGEMKVEGGAGGGSSLVRHSSSPAGLFANINIENEFGSVRSIGNFGGGNSANAEASFSSASRFKNQMDFSSRHSSSRLMDPISEIGSNGVGESSRGAGQLDDNPSNDGDYIPGFASNSWDDSAALSDNFLQELADNENKRFSNANASGDQNKLSHHLSLPKSSAELSAMEKLLQDSVPCKIRAKRGCATHPRSIAERVRRTKISERIRKLQELVPNMEKQTNTSDMLDLAVDYIKDLQRQVKTLSDNRSKCSCSAKQES